MRRTLPFIECGDLSSAPLRALRRSLCGLSICALVLLWGGNLLLAQSSSRPVKNAAIARDPFEAEAKSQKSRRSVVERAAGEERGRVYEGEDRMPFGSEFDTEDEEIDEYSIPAYPPGPLWPSWTPSDDPARQPIFAPAGNYELISPSRGIWPEEEGQQYERVVASEADLNFYMATCPPPIDLYRPDGMAPAGVFGDHTLQSGQVLVSHRFNNQAFDGLLSGTQSVSTASALKQFPLVPQRGTFQEHLFTLEWAPTNDLTLQGILPVILRKIDFVGSDGSHPVVDVTDLYDIQLYALYVLKRWDRQQIHLNMGVQMPLGVFDPLQPGNVILVPTPTSPQLTYPTRTSDGTWDYLPGITYRGQSDWWTWGAQGLGIVRFGINRYGYRLGDEGNFNGWLSRRLNDWASASVRLNGHVWGNIFGADQRLNANLTPTNRTDLQAGQRMSILFGMNFMIPDGLLRGQFLGIEGGIPVYQSLDGPQLQQRYEIWTNLSIRW